MKVKQEVIDFMADRNEVICTKIKSSNVWITKLFKKILLQRKHEFF